MSVSLPHEAEAHKHPELGFFRKYVFSTDHKIIGIQFLFSTLIFLAIGGLLAMGVRLQLGWPHADHTWLSDLLKWPASRRTLWRRESRPARHVMATRAKARATSIFHGSPANPPADSPCATRAPF